jgi:GT2 family glycosyltransferase
MTRQVHMSEDRPAALAGTHGGQPPLVTVIVLSYDRPDLLQRSIASVLAQTYAHLEVIVVDNHSASSERIRDVVGQFAPVRLVANQSNLGFTGGMNRGLSEATGEYAYLTEDDIELDPRCLEEIVGYLQLHPATGLAGPIMFNRRAGTIRCAGGWFALGAVYRMTIFGVSKRRRSAFFKPFAVAYLPGSTMCARLALWRRLGGFRDDFFMYGEDVELCARLLEQGHEIVVVPAAKVFHEEPADAGRSSLLAFHKQKNLAATYLLHASAFVLPAFVFRYGVIGFLRALTGNRPQLGVFLKAWWWVFRNSPRLIASRRRGASLGNDAAHAGVPERGTSLSPAGSALRSGRSRVPYAHEQHSSKQ